MGKLSVPFLGIFMLKHALVIFCAGASLTPATAQSNPKTHPPTTPEQATRTPSHQAPTADSLNTDNAVTDGLKIDSVNANGLNADSPSTNNSSTDAPSTNSPSTNTLDAGNLSTNNPNTGNLNTNSPSINNLSTNNSATKTLAYAPVTPDMTADSQAHTPQNTTWLDDTRHQTKTWLNSTAAHMDDWFGTPTPHKKASASLRFMLDIHDNKYDGTTIKPKIRGRLKLPTLENRLSIMVGDDTLDNNATDVGSHSDSKSTGQRFDREQVKEENTSLALRFSKWRSEQNIESDFDIGTRSGGEIYARLRAEKRWQWNATTDSRLEQIYRYGNKSEHYLRTNFISTWQDTPKRFLTNHAYIDYSHNDTETFVLGNNLYQTHLYDGRLGTRRLAYGLHAESRPKDLDALNRYGVFMNYRQPVWRDWFFVQTEMNYYNNKAENKDHHLATFLRLEAVF